MNPVPTWTRQDIAALWTAVDAVRCRGSFHGTRCDKVLAKKLRGSVSLKCGRCGHVETYSVEAYEVREKGG